MKRKRPMDMTAPRSSLLEAALKYRRVELSPIPCRARSKFPDQEALRLSRSLNFLGHPSWMAFGGRLASDEALKTWFESGTRSLGIATGYRDLLVLDFDSQAGYKEWSRRYERVASHTGIQRTPQGFHVFLRWQNVHTTRHAVNNDFCLDGTPGTRVGQIKGASDYVIAWPSFHPDGSQYRWLPGQAPWETKLVRIESLDQIGVVPVRKPLWRYLAFLAVLLARPRERVPQLARWIKNKYGKLTGAFFKYG